MAQSFSTTPGLAWTTCLALALSGGCKTRDFNTESKKNASHGMLMSVMDVDSTPVQNVCGEVTAVDAPAARFTLVPSPMQTSAAQAISAHASHTLPNASPKPLELQAARATEVSYLKEHAVRYACLAYYTLRGTHHRLVPGSLRKTQGPANALPQANRSRTVLKGFYTCGQLSSAGEFFKLSLPESDTELLVVGSSKDQDEALRTVEQKHVCLSGTLFFADGKPTLLFDRYSHRIVTSSNSKTK